jgi:hypothetical protein
MFRTYAFDQVPINRDVFLMDERWREEWEAAQVDMVDGRDDRVVGYISYIAVRNIGKESMELSWYPNISDRFHELSIRLPRSAFITCMDIPGWDVKPHVFVKSEWLATLHLRPYSAFALVDAIGVKHALSSGKLAGSLLVRLRDRIDQIAENTPKVAFLSFADSLLLKMNWFVGRYDTEVSYSYEPEGLIALIPAIAAVFREELGLSIYAVIAQGVNEYEDTALLHRSERGNHISLNSLGLPFAQLLAIDDAVRAAIRLGRHPPAELYLDEYFLRSLRFQYGFDRDALTKGPYEAPLRTVPGEYFCIDCQTILQNLDSVSPRSPK